jgi:hypothetical protein
MLAQELQRPMEFDHRPLLVKDVCAKDIVNKIAFKNRRKINRKLYGIGMPIEVYFRKPDDATVTKETANKDSLRFFATQNTKFLDDLVEDF